MDSRDLMKVLTIYTNTDDGDYDDDNGDDVVDDDDDSDENGDYLQ